MSSIDQQFIEYIVKSLVGKPEAVEIKRTIDEKGVLLELTVDPEDIGRVIGKRGSTAQSLRALLRALGTKNDARYNLKIVDVDRPEGERGRPMAAGPQDDDDGSVVADATEDVVADDEAVEEVAEAVEAKPVQNASDEAVDKSSELTKKTRAELADLDDFDI